MAVHEAGHICTVLILGGKISSVCIERCGCIVECTGLTTRQEFVAIAAGPAADLLLCVLCRQFPCIALCALLHSVFNLLPFYPLDGGRLWKRR